MAEVIGLTASLITLAGTGAKLAETLFKVASVIKSAESDARLLAADIHIFSVSLTQLSKVLEVPHPATNQLRDITVVLINACQALIEELRIYIGDPLPYASIRKSYSIKILRLRFKWLIHGTRVMSLKSLIDSFKFTTLLLVSSMDLATALHRHAPGSITESFKAQVESNIGFAESATQDLFRYDGVGQSSPTDQQPNQTLSEQPQRLQIQNALSETDYDAVTVHSTRYDGDDAQSKEHMALLLPTSRTTSKELSNTAESSDESEYEDEHQLQISHECSQIFRIHRLADKLAREVLSQTMPQTTWSWTKSTHVEQPIPADNASQGTPVNNVFLPAKDAQSSSKLDVKSTGQFQSTNFESGEPASPNIPKATSDYMEAGVLKVEPHPRADASQKISFVPRPKIEDEENDELGHPVDSPAVTLSSTTIGESFDEDVIIVEEDSDSGAGSRLQDQQLPHPDWRRYRKVPRRPSGGDERYPQGTTWNEFPRNDSQSSPPPPPLPRPPPRQESADQSILEKLAAMLSQEDTRRAKELEEERQKAENAKFSRLEDLLKAQQTARIEKEARKKKEAEEAALKAAEAKKKGNEDKLLKLEQLIIAQKNEQMKLEAAREAAARAQKAELDVRLAKAAEKQAAAEAAGKLLEAAKQAREEAEIRASREAEETKAAHEKALREALQAAQELARANEEAQKAADALPAIKIEDATGRKLLCPWKLGRSFQGMQDFIEQLSFGVPAMTKLVESGQYDLVKDGLTIAPQQWKAIIHPGVSIKMRDRTEKGFLSVTRSKLPISVDTPKPLKNIPWLRKSSSKTVDASDLGSQDGLTSSERTRKPTTSTQSPKEKDVVDNGVL